MAEIPSSSTNPHLAEKIEVPDITQAIKSGTNQIAPEDVIYSTTQTTEDRLEIVLSRIRESLLRRIQETNY